MRLRSLTLTSTAAPALALVLSAGILIGCGSSSDSAASTAPLTQAEYVQTAEAICKVIEREVFDAPSAGVTMAMYNLDDSIRDFARACMHDAE